MNNINVKKKGINITNKLGKVHIARLDNIADELECLYCDVDDPTGPFGAKGVAEISVLTPAPAICNAIFDACGYRVTRLPICDREPEIKEAAQKRLSEINAAK